MSNSLVNSLNELYYGCKYMVFNICNGSNHIFDLTNNIQTEYVMIFGESNPTIFSDKLSYQLAFTELNLDPYLGAAFLFSTSSKLINGLSIENWLALYSNVIYAFIVELPADQSIEMVNGWDIKSSGNIYYGINTRLNMQKASNNLYGLKNICMPQIKKIIPPKQNNTLALLKYTPPVISILDINQPPFINNLPTSSIQ